MPAIQNAQIVNLPPPFRGQFDLTPIVSVQSPFCEEMVNFNTDSGLVYLRSGDTISGSLNSSSEIGVGLVTTSTGILYLVTNSPGTPTRYDLWNGTGSSIHNFVCANTEYYCTHVSFNNTTFVFGLGGFADLGGFSLVGTGAPTLNPYGLAGSLNIFKAAPHKNRLYMAEREGTTIAYSGIDAISGAYSELDIGSLLTMGGYIANIGSVHVSDGIRSSQLFIVLSTTGEILAFDGSYPASSDWEMVGRFFISPPLSYDAFIEKEGDILVLSRTAIFSIRQLFTQPSSIAKNASISESITNRWQEIFLPESLNFDTNEQVSGVWDVNRNRLIINIPNWVYDTSGGFESDYVGYFSFLDTFSSTATVINSSINNAASAASRTVTAVLKDSSGATVETASVVLTNATTVGDFVIAYNLDADESTAAFNTSRIRITRAASGITTAGYYFEVTIGTEILTAGSGALSFTEMEARRAFFVFDFDVQSWVEHVSLGAQVSVLQLARASNQIYYTTEIQPVFFVKEGATDTVEFLDPFRKIDGYSNESPLYRIKTAPFFLDSYSSRRISGLEIICLGDFYLGTAFMLVEDLGRAQTGELRLPDGGSGLTKPFLSIGAAGSYVQCQVDSKIDQDGPSALGFEIYGINVLYTPGGMR